MATHLEYLRAAMGKSGIRALELFETLDSWLDCQMKIAIACKAPELPAIMELIPPTW